MSKRNNVRNFIFSDFYCTKCGLKNFPIIRTIGGERESGHLKKLFCIHCQQEVNMVEIKPKGKYTLNEFWLEYEYGNFDEHQNRIMPWKQFITKLEKGEDKNGLVHE